jgi:hypothetical protein
MAEKQVEKKVEYQLIELIANHTHRGRSYGPDDDDKPNDVLKLRTDQAQRLIGRKIGKPAATGAQPLNVDGNGNLF